MRICTDIQVRAHAAYLPKQSKPMDNRYLFGYTIMISNDGDQPATLYRRHWTITNDAGCEDRVSGEGVLGQKPKIMPGKHHKYTSFALLETPVGCMHGFYEFYLADGEDVVVEVPVFSLAVPGVVS